MTTRVSVLLNTTATNATTPTFAAQTTFTVGNSPVSVAVADVNGDGKPDLVVANFNGNSVSVLLNTTATERHDPHLRAADDLRRGRQPLLGGGGGCEWRRQARSRHRQLQWQHRERAAQHHGDGATAPTFASQTTFAVGSRPHSVAVADVNGDGKPDLVVANHSDNSVSVLLNTAPVDLAIATTGLPTAAVPGRTVTTTLTATNTGVNATGTTVTFALDPNLTFQSAAFTSGATGTVSQSGGTVTFTFASGLANGATATLTVTAQVVAAPTGMTATSVATITGGANDFETNTMNNTMSVFTTLLAPITLAPASPLPAATFGTAYSQTLTASGGTGTGFGFAVTSGSLPPGLTLSAAGVVSGTPTAAGVYSFTVTATDGGGNMGSLAYSLSVNKASTTTNVMALQNPSVFGQSVTLAATVGAVAPGGGTPTGTVTFTSGSFSATATLSGGFATTSATGLPVGAGQTITATYNGDGNFVTSSGTITQTVNKAGTTTTGVIAAPATSVFGQSVTLSATVSAVAPGAGTPTGTVTFTSGSFSATATLTNGVASLPTTTLPVGANQTITATYNGDGNFTGSNGTTTTTVNKASTVRVSPRRLLRPYSGKASPCPRRSAPAPGAGTPTGTVTFTSGSFTATATLSGGVATTSTTACPWGQIRRSPRPTMAMQTSRQQRHDQHHRESANDHRHCPDRRGQRQQRQRDATKHTYRGNTAPDGTDR